MKSEKRIAAYNVRQLCGGVSDMTLWRWLNDTEMAFPKPIYIGRRRYWKEADVIAWLESREIETAA
jgi:predicted DNA-binding transcriptional regulator AlpA